MPQDGVVFSEMEDRRRELQRLGRQSHAEPVPQEVGLTPLSLQEDQKVGIILVGGVGVVLVARSRDEERVRVS